MEFKKTIILIWNFYKMESLVKTTNCSYNYTKICFDFEQKIDEPTFSQWMSKNWQLCLWSSAIYVVLIFGGKYLMQERQRFDLRPALALWSGLLGIFSLFGAARTIPELIYVLKHHGLEFSICSASYFSGPTGFWAVLFTVSKVYELGDTLFIVLRKQELIFLHWYHHICTLVYTWSTYADHPGTGRWFMVMNYSVHSVMYTYYAFRALRFQIPKFVSLIITSLQIAQMVVGTVFILYAHHILSMGRYCSASSENLKIAFMMYFSYLVLFSHFFYSVYIKPNGKFNNKQKIKGQ